MRTFILSSLFLLLPVISASAQQAQTATTNGAVRLFADTADLTSVITLVPSGTQVEVLASDTIFALIHFDDYEGYVKSDKLTIQETSASSAEPSAPVSYQYQAEQSPASQYDQDERRFNILLSKYGATVANALYQHKVWKGVTAEMARDSWGKPKQVNRMYVDQRIDEEWIYSKKWLYFRNDLLVEWGPVQN